MNFQTIGMSDEGYYLSTYQLFFKAPECNEGGFLFYLTSLIGGLWDFFFGKWGIISYRVLWALVSMITFYYVVKILSEYIQYRWWILTAFLLLNIGFFPGVFSNKSLSVLLGTVSLYYLSIFIIKNKRSSLFVASIILGLNVFCRLPNIVILLLLPAAVFVHKKYRSDNGTKMLANLFVCFAGVAIGAGLVLVVMLALGHLGLFYKVLNDMLADGADSEASHNYLSMLLFYLRDYAKVLGCFMLWSIGIILLKRYFTKSMLMVFVSICVSSILIVLVLSVSPDRFRYSFVFLGLAIAMAILYMCKYKERNLNVILLMSFLYVILQPIGTDYGNAIWGTLSPVVLLPASMIAFQKSIKDYPISEIKIINTWLLVLLFIIVVVRTHYTLTTGSWADPGNRCVMKYSVTESSLGTVFTTKRKAESIDALLRECDKYVKENDYLFCYMSIPLINYLSKTKPYLHCSSSAYYTPSAFNNQMKNAVKEKGSLPVVVYENNVVGWKGWKEKKEIFEKFLNDNAYIEVWNNQDYRLLLPQKK